MSKEAHAFHHRSCLAESTGFKPVVVQWSGRPAGSVDGDRGSDALGAAAAAPGFTSGTLARLVGTATVSRTRVSERTPPTVPNGEE